MVLLVHELHLTASTSVVPIYVCIYIYILCMYVYMCMYACMHARIFLETDMYVVQVVLSFTYASRSGAISY